MNLTFLVDHDLASLLALNLLIPKLGSHNIRVFYTSRPSKPNAPQALKELSLFNTQVLQSQPFPNSFEKFKAEKLNDINDADFQRFADSKPDLTVSIRHMSILKPPVINIPSKGIINLHSGPLPQYQGVMATFWAMLNKELHGGTSLHFIEDQGIDKGSIIARSSTQLQYEKSYLWNVLNLYKAGCSNILDAVKSLSLNQELESEIQIGNPQYFTYPDNKDIALAQFPFYDPIESVRLS